LVRVAGDDLAGGRADTMSGKQLDHAMAIRVANGLRGIDDDRAALLRVPEPIEDRAALAHHEDVGEMGVELGIGGHELDVAPACRPGRADPFQNGAIVVDPSRRMRELAVDAPAGPRRAHAPPTISRLRPNSAASAAAMSRARSMSNTHGSTMPRTGGCSATS